MKKVLVTGSFGKFNRSPIEMLEQAGFQIVQIKEHPLTDEDKLLKYIDDDIIAIVNGLEPIGRKTMEAAKGLKLVVKHGAGVNNIDLEAAKELGIAVANTPGANKEAVADLAFGLMLAVARNISQADASMKAGKWEGFFGRSVYGRTLGIVGMGAIGKSLAKRANGFSMKILGYDPYWDEDFAKENDIERCSIDELVKQSDFISIHTPLLPETDKLINKDRLEIMKETAYIINTARGEIIDEQALYQVLADKKIAGAGIDAFSKEPLAEDDPILSLNNVILTPHIAFYSDEAMHSTSLYAANNIIEFFEKQGVFGEEKIRWLVVEPPKGKTQ